MKLPMLHSVTVPTGKLIRDEELGAISDDDDDSPSGKRSKLDRFLLSRCELAVSLGVFLVFSSGLFCIYITMPAAESGKLKLPKKHLWSPLAQVTVKNSNFIIAVIDILINAELLWGWLKVSFTYLLMNLSLLICF